MNKLYRAALAGGLLAAAGAAPARAAPTYFAVQTGMSGGQTGIDAVSTSSWNFTTGPSWVFGGGTFEMKTGSSTSAEITLSIRQGTNSAGAEVGSITYTRAQFGAVHGGNSQSFAPVAFLFATPLALQAGAQYFVALTSNAGTNGAQQYFIKGQTSTLRFEDEGGGAMPMGLITSGDGVDPAYVAPTTPTAPGGALPPTGVPAPGGLGLFGFAMLWMGASLALGRPAARATRAAA